MSRQTAAAAVMALSQAVLVAGVALEASLAPASTSSILEERSGCSVGGACSSAREAELSSLLQATSFAAPRLGAVQECNGTLAGQRLAADVVVPYGASCTVRNTTLLASLTVEGSLLLDGGSEVSGGVEVSAGPGTVTEIRQARIGGGLKLMGTSLGGGALRVGAGARVGGIEASGWEAISISDCVVPGVKTKGCTGGIAFSNALVGEVDVDGGAGGIELKNTTVQFDLSVSQCVNCTIIADAMSKIGKGLNVEKSVGSVWMKGTVLGSGSLSISGLDGGVLLEDMSVREVDVGGVLGNVSLHNVTLGGGSTFEKNTGNFVAELCSFEELKMASPFHGITLRSNDFHSMAVSIKSAHGPVLLQNNRDLDLYLEENDYGVTLGGNSIHSATIAKNLGNTTLAQNRFDMLKCSDNSHLELLGNNVTDPMVGQCAPALIPAPVPAPLPKL